MKYPDPSEPEIVGCERKASQPSTGTDFKTPGITAVCVVIGVVAFCQITGTGIWPNVPSAPQANTKSNTDAPRYSWTELQNSIRKSEAAQKETLEQQREVINSIQEANESRLQNHALLGGNR